MPLAISERFQKYIESLVDETPEAWIFPSDALTTAIDPSNALKNYIKPRLKAIHMDWLTFQILRRSHTTHSKEAGADQTIMAFQQGHSVDVHNNEYLQPGIEMLIRESSKLYEVFARAIDIIKVN